MFINMFYNSQLHCLIKTDNVIIILLRSTHYPYWIMRAFLFIFSVKSTIILNEKGGILLNKKLFSNVFIASLILGACSTPSKEHVESVNPIQAEAATNDEGLYTAKGNVLSVTDGNTIKVKITSDQIAKSLSLSTGQVATIRLLGTLAPNVDDKSGIGAKATDFLQDFLDGEEVSLEIDPNHIKNKNGEYQAYISKGKNLIQSVLLQKGYATLTPLKNTANPYINTFKDMANQAKEKNLSIWSIPEFVTQNNTFDNEAVVYWKNKGLHEAQKLLNKSGIDINLSGK